MSNYSSYVGNRKSLRFPVMCDGYVKLDYDDNVASSPYGIWELNDSFTIQSIITPYEINGNTGRSSISQSERLMPKVSTGSQSTLYLPETNRLSHRMVIFYNTNVELFLENTTKSVWGQPAEYRIGFRIKTTNDDTLYSNTIIVPIKQTNNMTDLDDMYDITTKIRSYYRTASAVATTSGVSGIDIEIPISGSASLFGIGANIYDDTNTLIGEIAAIDTSGTHELRIVAAGGYTHSDFNATSKKIYLEVAKEPLYIFNTHHISASYNNASGEMAIYYNGTYIGGKIHKDEGASDFNFNNSHVYLGQNAEATNPRYTQFMGEIHELSLNNDVLNSFPSISTLYPQRKNLLLYLNFEGGDLTD